MDRSLLFLVVMAPVFVGACGRAPSPELTALPPTAEADATAAAVERAANESAAGQLAVALGGDVKHLGDTRYEAVGPELRCSAMILPDDGGAAVPATSLVEWKVEPEDAGTFSIGAQGAYFLPSSPGVVTIRAELTGAAGLRRSPGLSLSVSSSGPAPAG